MVQCTPDDQCANNRGGILCGGCRENFTLALEGSKCIECSSRYALLWMIPVCVLAGIALVALLLVCNMTVSHGTLNGLIFYANIVSITGLTNPQNCSIHPILSIFIAWINLDFGIETCFYPGLDSYYKTLLQFAPVCFSPLHRVTSRCYSIGQSLFHHCSEGLRKKQHCYTNNPLPSLLYKDTQDHLHSSRHNTGV